MLGEADSEIHGERRGTQAALGGEDRGDTTRLPLHRPPAEPGDLVERRQQFSLFDGAAHELECTSPEDLQDELGRAVRRRGEQGRVGKPPGETRDGGRRRRVVRIRIDRYFNDHDIRPAARCLQSGLAGVTVLPDDGYPR